MANPELGILFHAIGGLAAGSFYIPFKRVTGWSWETYWLVAGVASWIIAPTVGAMLTVDSPFSVIAQAPMSSVLLCFLFGALWGVGGLTFGLSMRYLGMSLGYALALGACAAFGTLIPPIVNGKLGGMLQTLSGQFVLGGILVCLIGIGICGLAGMKKEQELPDEVKRQTIKEFNFRKGVLVVLFAGVMSACMSFAMEAAQPIKDAAVAAGAKAVFSSNPAFIVIMLGGFVTNFAWCVIQHFQNRSAGEYGKTKQGGSLGQNYLLCIVAGFTWYLQFFFYGMGSVNLGKQFEFASWTLHMAFIIVFSNLWALAFKEWSAAGRTPRWLIGAGIAVLILSTIVIGYGTKLSG